MKRYLPLPLLFATLLLLAGGSATAIQEAQDGVARPGMGSLTSKILLPPDEEPLESLWVHYDLPTGEGEEKELLQIGYSCTVKEGRMRCPMHAGRLDFKLRAKGFVPVYFWGLQVEPGKNLDLKEVALRRGASVSGWVETAQKLPPGKGCRVELTPESAGEAERLEVAERLKRLTLETRPNDRGFFQFVGVPEGRYKVTATSPGLAPVSLSPIEVRSDLESQVIERLTLAPPVSFEVVLDPPVEPYGQPWKILLHRRDGPSEPIREEFKGQASQEGLWKIASIPPGTYELSIRGELNSQWHSEFVEVGPSGAALHVEIPGVRVRGSVTLGGAPLAATVWLSREGRRLRFDSDAEGRFEGLLTEAGVWKVELRAEEEDLRLRLEPVEVRVPRGKRFAEVEIAVPDTTLAGEVVDESGKPVPAAQIGVTHLEKLSRGGGGQFVADEKGKFSIRGLPPGPFTLIAELDDLQSDWLQGSLAEGEEGASLRIVLRRLRKVKGRIVSPQGGVPGARVTARPTFGGQTAVSGATDVTGPDGAFEVDLPGDALSLDFIVFPPGYAMKMVSALASPDQPMEISLERQGGTLVLEFSGEGPAPLLVHNGVFVTPRFLHDWARLQGARPSSPNRLVVPNVEGGAYSLCLGTGVVSRLRQGEEPPAANCASGVLSPYGELILRAPSGKPTR
jgi:hypothetical protein